MSEDVIKKTTDYIESGTFTRIFCYDFYLVCVIVVGKNSKIKVFVISGWALISISVKFNDLLLSDVIEITLL